MSKGMHAVGQAEVVVLLQCLPDEKTFPRDIFTHFIQLYRDALTGTHRLLSAYCYMHFVVLYIRLYFWLLLGSGFSNEFYTGVINKSFCSIL